MDGEDEGQYRPVPGYAALIDFLQGACLKCNGVIKTGEPVKKITCNENIEIHTNSGKFICNKVIVAVPVGVLQCRKNNESFINLPSNLKKGYTKAAKQIGNGGAIKFFIRI